MSEEPQTFTDDGPGRRKAARDCTLKTFLLDRHYAFVRRYERDREDYRLSNGELIKRVDGIELKLEKVIYASQEQHADTMRVFSFITQWTHDQDIRFDKADANKKRRELDLAVLLAVVIGIEAVTLVGMFVHGIFTLPGVR